LEPFINPNSRKEFYSCKHPSNFFVSCLFGLALSCLSGCGGGGDSDSLTDAERIKADSYIAIYGGAAIVRYLVETEDTDEKCILKHLEYFVSKGADVNAEASPVGTLLHWVLWSGSNIEVVKFLISKGADVNAKDEAGRTPLHTAVTRGDIEIVKFLVSKGADVKAKTNDGMTPIQMVAWDSEVAKFLVSKGVVLPVSTPPGPAPAPLSAE
jgi:hypothetical protein